MCKNRNSRLLIRLIVDVVLLIGVCCVALIVLPQTLKTVQRGFFCSDESLMYPYTASLLSKVHMTILVIALPAAVILIVEMLYAGLAQEKNTRQFSFVGMMIPTIISECYTIIGSYLFGFALQLIASKVTQYYVGRLRPYFFDVCQPQLVNGSSCADAQHRGRYIEDYTCSELAASPELLATVYHSFPSAYATSSAYAMCFLVFYLQARLTASWLKILRAALQFACLALAGVVALERVSSFRHHWTDVVAGIGFGFVFAAFATILVANLFQRITVKTRKLREEPNYIYGYYTGGHRARTRKYC